VNRELHFDVAVIGAGTAGLTAAACLAEAGARVCVLTKGVGSTHLAAGTVDVLGYSPERVEAPGTALEELVRSAPDHPYALIGPQAVGAALRWFDERVAAGPLPGYRYTGGLERNHLLPTAVGALRPSALVPETMTAGDCAGGLADPKRVCVVGVRALRDFHPALCAANLQRAGIETRSVELEPELDRADQNSLGLARRLDDPGWRAAFCAELALHLRGDERVGLPAMLGLSDPHGVWTDLERRLGRPVFEIPTLPPSVPGMRLFEILRSALRAAGARLMLGSEVIGADRDGSRVIGLRALVAGGERRYLAESVVLATGGFASGGLETDSHWVTRERVLGLPLRGVPGDDQARFVGPYLEEQPMARVGVAVDGELRAQGADNVVVVGAALAGAVSWREGSGEGIALASGFRAAEVLRSAAVGRGAERGASKAVA
jgi:glycerol-3-phosphate dehydrogenase subunit B